MQFASPHVCLAVDAGEVEIDASDLLPRDLPRDLHGRRRGAGFNSGRRNRFRRKIDTNVLKLSLGEIARGAAVATGEAFFCGGCRATLSVHSQLKRQAGAAAGAAADLGGAGGEEEDEGPWDWECEFCGRFNVVDIPREEIPTDETVDFIITPPRVPTDAEGDGLVLFVVDVSGSMCVTTEVPGNHILIGDHHQRHRTLAAGPDTAAVQRLPGERRNVTYVSRLQAVQASVTAQLDALAKEHPQRRVGLIAFSNSVTVFGDSQQGPVVVSGAALDDPAGLRSTGEALRVETDVGRSIAGLRTAVAGLEEGGATALGPAAVLAIAQACRATGGARVVLCTDGASNVGVGQLEGLAADADVAAVDEFYGALAQEAATAGVVVDVVGIEGQCDLETLGVLAEKTGGAVVKVNPRTLHSDFAAIMDRPPVGTQASVTVHLHAGLEFRGTVTAAIVEEDVGDELSDSEAEEEGEDCAGAGAGAGASAAPGSVPADAQSDPVGEPEAAAHADAGLVGGAEGEAAEGVDTEAASPAAPPAVSAPATESAASHRAVTADTAAAEARRAGPSASDGLAGSRLTRAIGNVFEDTEVTFEFGVRSDGADFAALDKLPFQVQISFTRQDGARMIRVISASRPVTRDRQVAEAEMDPEVLGVHAMQQSAAIARTGDYESSVANAAMFSSFMGQRSRSAKARSAYDAWSARAAGFMDAVGGAVRMENDADDAVEAEPERPAAQAAARAPGGVLRSRGFPFGGFRRSPRPAPRPMALQAAAAPPPPQSREAKRKNRRKARSGQDDFSSFVRGAMTFNSKSMK